MKIVFTCDTMNAGGAERVISVLANGFVESGHSVTIVMVSYDKDVSFYKLNKQIKLIPLIRQNKKRTNFFKRSNDLRKTILEIQPDVVISFLSHVCIYTWFALKNTRIPYLVSERNDPNQHSFLRKLILKFAYKKSAGCVFQTHDAQDWFGTKIKNKSIIIYNPINVDKSIKRSCENNVVYAVGRLVDQKNYFFMLDSFKIFLAKNPSFKLIIRGDGKQKEQLFLYAKEINIANNVDILPVSKEWHNEVVNSKMFILASKYEGMPNALAEALALGVPCCSTNCPIGGPSELNKLYKNRLILVDEYKADDFAKGMGLCLKLKYDEVYIPDELLEKNIVKKWINFIEDCIKK